jgi:hypothetical protein
VVERHEDDDQATQGIQRKEAFPGFFSHQVCSGVSSPPVRAKILQ